jgi:hypothetical protein
MKLEDETLLLPYTAMGPYSNLSKFLASVVEAVM